MNKKDKISFGRCKYCKETAELKNGICGKIRCQLISMDKNKPLSITRLVNYLVDNMKIKK